MHKLRLKLLQLLNEKNQCYNQLELSKLLNISKQLARYHLNFLIKEKLITPKKLGCVINYQPSKLGNKIKSKKILTPSEKTLKKFYSRAHDLRFKCPITRRPTNWEKQFSWKTVPLKNWTKGIRTIEGYTVELTPKNIIYRIDELLVDDPRDAVSMGYDIVRRINRILEEENERLVLGKPFVDIVYFYGHQAIQNDPFAKWCKSKRVRVRYKDVSVDASKGKAEIEFENPALADEHATKYLSFVNDIINDKIDLKTIDDLPHYLNAIAFKVDELKKKLDTNSPFDSGLT